MKRLVTFYFSFTEIVEDEDEEKIIKKTEEMAIKELGRNCFNYFDDRTIEEV